MLNIHNGPLGRKLRFGVIGGGEGSFIAAVHVRAAIMDGRAELVAGCFSSDPAKTKAAAPAYGVAANRAYGTYREMLRSERARGGDGIDFVIIATPNHLHGEMCIAAYDEQTNVMTDKPLTHTLDAARQVYNRVTRPDSTGLTFGITYNYATNPMAVLATEMVRQGDLGEVIRVKGAYLQDWLGTKLEDTDQKQAKWRTNPALAGAGAFGDIGSHSFVQGLRVGGFKPKRLRGKLRTQVKGRQIDDNGTVEIETESGCHVTIEASQVAQGHMNDHTLSVYGTKRSLHWAQERPDELWVYEAGQPRKQYFRNVGSVMSPTGSGGLCRIPPGHPEAYFEGMANAYLSFYDRLVAKLTGTPAPTTTIPPLGIEIGLAANIFIDAALRASEQDGWVSMEDPVFDLLVV